MPASIQLGRVAGIPVGLHYSWLIIATLIAFSLADYFRTSEPAWDGAAVWGTAVITAVLFFVALLAHEMSHALVARRRGLRVRSITLFALGGIARIDAAGNTAATEVLVAVVGPVTSVIIGIGCLAGATALGWTPGGQNDVMAALLGWLGSINVLLAAFNLIPGYPLDGGRILRGVLWGLYDNLERATRHATRVGQVVAATLMFFGVYQFFAGGRIDGLWLGFIGWFLLSAAEAEYTQVTVSESLRGIRVADVMASDCDAVSDALASMAQQDVNQLPVLTGGRLAGIITRGHILQLLQARAELAR
jgi:Zn-dependent protease